MLLKRYCFRCGSKHKAGCCDLDTAPGGRNNPGRRSLGPGKVPPDNCGRKHKWRLSLAENYNRKYHQRWWFCKRCHFNPNERELERHKFKGIYCDACGATSLNG